MKVYRIVKKRIDCGTLTPDRADRRICFQDRIKQILIIIQFPGPGRVFLNCGRTAPGLLKLSPAYRKLISATGLTHPGQGELLSGREVHKPPTGETCPAEAIMSMVREVQLPGSGETQLKEGELLPSGGVMCQESEVHQPAGEVMCRDGEMMMREGGKRIPEGEETTIITGISYPAGKEIHSVNRGSGRVEADIVTYHFCEFNCQRAPPFNQGFPQKTY